MRMEKKDTGKLGEDEASALLTRKGYTILERNWRYKKLEIDIIAIKDGVLVFAEVKTRSTREFGDPADFLKYAQKTLIIRGANRYIEAQAPAHNDVRFDVFSVFWYGSGLEIQHIEEAFYPMVNQYR